MKHNKKMWFAYFTSLTYKDEPNFFEMNQLSWVPDVISKSNEIKIEVEDMLGSAEFSPKNYFIEGLTDNGGWKTFSLKTWGIDVKQAMAKMPVLASLSKNNSNIVSISINVLEPGTEIKAHHGDSNTFYRSHLGVIIPGSLPECGFKVNDESRPWKEGELLTFTDGNIHSAWNFSRSKRDVVVFDVIKDEYQSQRRYICFRVRTFLLLQLLFEKYPKYKQAPKWIHTMTGFKIFCILVCLYPYQKLFGVIKKHN